MCTKHCKTLKAQQCMSLSENCRLSAQTSPQPHPTPGKRWEVTGITYCDILIATSFLCWGSRNGFQLSKVVHSVPTPVPIQLFPASTIGNSSFTDCLWRHCHSESCKWGGHILWLRMLYFIGNYFKNCKQSGGLCSNLTSKCIIFAFLGEIQTMLRGHAAGLRNTHAFWFLGLANLVQQLLAHFHVCTFLPAFPKERASHIRHHASKHT